MKAVAMETADGSGSQTNEDIVNVRVFIPELQLEKFFQFNVEELVWDVKQHILSSLPKELKESFNYGIFILPRDGKAGKFLDEERLLLDYPLSEPVEYLELRYKRRVYKTMNVDEKQIKQLHTRANLRRMIDYINCGNVEKINKLCTKGLDPNFHCPESGETSLTLATALPQPAKVLMELVNGGAHLDFRMKDGRTAVHRAVERDNFEALKSLLDLGSSPNYKDNRGLTALYYSVFYGCDPKLTELLLHDHAIFGIVDHQGWQEVHQACKHGLVQHLENLLFYGADINSRNASGNTPLHVCAVNDQESCARLLLFRGADKNALNYANQNPYQVAVIAGNHHMAELIQKHRPEDVVPYREAPQYNLRRRASAAVAAMSRNNSDPRLELGLGCKPPSPCPSYRSLPPFSSVSTISEASTGSSSTCTQPSGEDSEDTASASVVTEKSVTSDSSGVCTSNSGTSESTTEHGDNPILPGTTCVCVEDYSPCSPGHLQLMRGDIVDVVGISECGLLEGRLRNEQEGLFPSSAVQEVKLRKIEALPPSGQPRIEGRRELNARKINTIPRQWKMYGDARTVILHKGKKGFGFVLRGAQATSPLMERQPTDNWPSLQYLDDVDKGGVADLAGLKKGDFLLEINGQDVSQASHERVVGIIRQSGDLVAMTVVSVLTPPTDNASDKYTTTQRQCATLPRKLSLKKAPPPPKRDPRTTLSVGRIRARSLVAGLSEIEVLERTINEYDSEGRSTKSSSIESIPNKPGNLTAEGNNKVASIRSRPSSRRISTAELEDIFARQRSVNVTGPYSTLVKKSIHSAKMPKVYGSVAAMKRSKASRSKVSEVVKLHKEFHSTPDLNNKEISDDMIDIKKKCKSQEDVSALNIKNSRHSWACPPHNNSKPFVSSVQKQFASYHETSKSIEELYEQVKDTNNKDILTNTEVPSQIYAETLSIHQNDKVPVSPRTKCPPPTHRPPPPPQGQVVKVDVSRTIGEYANITAIRKQDCMVMSSFRPGDSAKLYASPESVMPVGYKSRPETRKLEHCHPRRGGGGSSLRSHSLPPKIPVPKLLTSSNNTSSEIDNNGGSGAIYSTFRLHNKQRDSISSNGSLMSKKVTLKPQKPFADNVSFTSASTIHQSHKKLHCELTEPYIPEPDYESSEDNEREEVCLSSKGIKNDTATLQDKEESLTDGSSYPKPHSPHTEAKRAIQEARERLRFTQKFQSKTINSQESIYSNTKTRHDTTLSYSCHDSQISSSVVKENPQDNNSKVLQIIEKTLSMSHKYSDKEKSDIIKLNTLEDTLNGKKRDLSVNSSCSVKENISVFEEKEIQNNSATLPSRKNDGIRIALTGAQYKTETCQKEVSSPLNSPIRPSKSFPKNFVHEDVEKYENSSSGVSSDVEVQSECVVMGPFNGQISKKFKKQNSVEEKIKCIDNTSKQVVTKEQNLLGKSINMNYVEDISTVMPVSKVNTSKLPSYNHQTISYVKRAASKLGQSQYNSSAVKLMKPLDNDSLNKSQCSPIPLKEINFRSVSSVSDSKAKLKKVSDENLKLSQSIDESLQLIRLQVDSLGRAAVNEVDVFTELVPPPPEFAAPPSSYSSTEQFSSMIAPPLEFCDGSARKFAKKDLSNVQQFSSTASNSSGQSESPDVQRTSYSYRDYSYQTVSGSKVVQTLQHGDMAYMGCPSKAQMNDRDSHLATTMVKQLGTRVLPNSIPSSRFPTNHLTSSPVQSDGDKVVMKSIHEAFHQKPLLEWNNKDVSEWLESLFLPEYKACFTKAGITGAKLINIDSNDLMGLGVKQVSHRLHIERSIKHYMK